MSDVEEYLEKVREELEKYKIGDTRLSDIFDQLLEACKEETKTPKELQDCIAEGVATLKTVLRKVKA